MLAGGCRCLMKPLPGCLTAGGAQQPPQGCDGQGAPQTGSQDCNSIAASLSCFMLSHSFRHAGQRTAACCTRTRERRGIGRSRSG